MARVVSSLGCAHALLSRKGNVRPHATWMGITTSEKTYPDDMVMDFARWGSRHSACCHVVIADMMQIYNRIPFSKKGWDKWADHRSYKRAAQERKVLLEEQLRGVPDVDVNLMYYGITQQLQQTPGGQFMIDYAAQLLFTQDKESLHEDVRTVTRERAGPMLKRAVEQGADPDFALNVMRHYALEEILLSWYYAERGFARIKIGPVGEHAYDEITMDLIDGAYGTFDGGRTTFGAVHLEGDS